MALKSIPLYFLKHWRGELSLITSFWINIVALNLLVLGFIDPYLNPFSVINLTFDLGPSIGMLVSFAFYIIDPNGLLTLEDPVSIGRTYIIWAVFKLAILYSWQFIGLMRSCNRYVVERGKTYWASTAQLLVVIGIAGVVVNTNQHWLDYRDFYQEGFGPNRVEGYKIELIKDGTFIHLKGDIARGVAFDVGGLLLQHPEVKGIILDSRGGWGDEGDSLGELVWLNELDTYVLGVCYSACTKVFIQGKHRFLGEDGFLGFHQGGRSWSVGQYYKDSLEDFQRKDKESDRTLFEAYGFKPDFYEKIHNTPPKDLWIPDLRELWESGLIDGIVKPDLTPFIGVVARFGVVVKLGESWHVTIVMKNSNAERIQLQKGDVLLQWDDAKLESYDDLVDQIHKKNYGDPYRIKIRRNNSVLELKGVFQKISA